VASIPVVPGQKVGRGALLATIESVEVGRARGDLATARMRVQQASADVERQKRLVAGGAAPERDLLVAETELATAKAQLQASEDRVGTLGVAAAGGGQTIPLVAPIPGTVLKLDARVGQPVGPTDTLVVVGETQDVWLDVEIYERDVGVVGLGDEVKVSSIAFPGRVFDGKVDQLGATVDPDRHVLDARVVLHNADGSLKPGMTATAQILGAAAGDGGTAIVVPRGAIQTIDGQAFVFVERGGPGKYAMQAVERGAAMGDDVEITRGLTMDETVVVDGAFILKSEVLKAQMGAND
jgi:cobalt-zinc-cadmium efflux system membrane fusion protein